MISGMRRPAVAALVALAAAACGSSGGPARSTPTVTVTRTVTVTPSAPKVFDLTGILKLSGGIDAFATTGSTCSGTSGYDDITSGTQVVVYDESSKVLASGGLGEGQPTDAGTTCTFPIVVDGVPRGHSFYQVQVSHRGMVTETAADAVAGTVTLTLGG